jgi:ribonuclease P protein component
MATQEKAPAAETRLPCPYEHSRRAKGHQASSRQGPYTACRLIGGLEREARDRSVGKPLTLRRSSDFERLFRQGERFRSHELLLIRLFRDTGGLRVAFVTARGAGKVARRNRLRRRLREACRSMWSEIADRPADVLFMALPPAAQSDYAALRNAMAKLLQRAGVLSATDVVE